GMYHVVCRPGLECRANQHFPYPFVRDRVEVVMGSDELFLKCVERPMVMTFGCIRAGGCNDECFMFRGDLLRLSGTRRIRKHCIDRTPLFIPYPYCSDIPRRT